MLRASGMTLRHLSDATGLSMTTIKRILRGSDKYVYSGTAEAILSCTPQRPDAQPHIEALVPTVGIARRLQALQVIGYTTQAISELIGYQYKTTPLLIHARKPYVEVGTARKVDEVYRRLMLTPAPHSRAADRARRRAVRHGWASALAWDGIDIDNPAAVPNPGEAVKLSTVDQILELREDGYTDPEIAERLGLKLDSIQQAARRYERRIAS